MSVRIQIIDSETELQELAGEWERLHNAASVASVFNSFDWQTLWWRRYHNDRPLRLLVAWRDAVVVGILPLYIDHLPSLLYQVRLLRLVGTGGDTSPDDLGPLLAPDDEASVAQAFAQAIRELPGWDVLLLGDLTPENAFTQIIAEDAHVSGRSQRITFMELPKSYEQFLQSLHRDRRYRLRSLRKKLNAAHQARFFVWQDAATLDTGIDWLIHLHHKRWLPTRRAHGFSSPEYVAFHRDLMHACLAHDRLRLYCLELDGRMAAMFYFYHFRHRIYLMQSGFDPAFAAVKPGHVLLGHVIEHAIGEGHQVLDFLRGEHRYKDELASGARETRFSTEFRVNVGAAAYNLRQRILPAVKARILEALGE